MEPEQNYTRFKGFAFHKFQIELFFNPSKNGGSGSQSKRVDHDLVFINKSGICTLIDNTSTPQDGQVLSGALLSFADLLSHVFF